MSRVLKTLERYRPQNAWLELLSRFIGETYDQKLWNAWTFALQSIHDAEDGLEFVSSSLLATRGKVTTGLSSGGGTSNASATPALSRVERMPYARFASVRRILAALDRVVDYIASLQIVPDAIMCCQVIALDMMVCRAPSAVLLSRVASCCTVKPIWSDE